MVQLPKIQSAFESFLIRCQDFGFVGFHRGLLGEVVQHAAETWQQTLASQALVPSFGHDICRASGRGLQINAVLRGNDSTY